MQTPGVLFIKLVDQMRAHINVNKLMEAILSHIKQGNVVTRFACRMIPVFSLQKANLQDFKEMCHDEVVSTFSHRQLKWCLEFKSRNNQKAVRAEFYEAVKDAINSTK